MHAGDDGYHRGRIPGDENGTMNVTPEVAAVLKSYVYVYIDPRNGEPFYVGKGKGGRLFTHLDDPSETEKTARRAKIHESGMEPRIDMGVDGIITDYPDRLRQVLNDLGLPVPAATPVQY